MPHVSSIFHKLVSAVTIVMASSDATRNAMKCEFFRNKIVLPSILLFLDAYEFDDTWVLVFANNFFILFPMSIAEHICNNYVH